MKEKIMPPFVLTLICIIVCGLLVFAYNCTYVDNTGVLTDDMKKGCEEIFGQGNYEIILEPNTEKKTPVTFGTEGVNSIITDKENNACLIEITQDGYSKGGIHILVGINDEGAVEGIYFLSIGETPGLGAEIAKPKFSDQFRDKKLFKDGEFKSVAVLKKGQKPAAGEDYVDAITGGTITSRGVQSMIMSCLSDYQVFLKNLQNDKK